MKTQLLELSPFEVDAGALIGRDPRQVSEAEYRAAIPRPIWGLSAIRAKCLDCAHSSMEVRKCVRIDCPLWPLRMGAVPLSLKRAGGFIPKAEKQ